MAGPRSPDAASDFGRAGLGAAGLSAGLSATDRESLGSVAAGEWAATASAAEVAGALGLKPHREGGFFRETYRSQHKIPTEFGERCLATSILYLLTSGSPSRFHRLRSDEVWFYQAGCRAELAMLAVGGRDQAGMAPATTHGSSAFPGEEGKASYPAASSCPPAAQQGRLRLRLLGPDQPQAFVPGGWWLGARVVAEVSAVTKVSAVTEAADKGGAAAADDDTGGGGGDAAGREWTLAGCVVTPGFEYEDFELAEPGSLLREFPEAAELIEALT